MVTFTEEILNGKLFYAVIRTTYNQWPNNLSNNRSNNLSAVVLTNFSNRSGGWNKREHWQISAKIINGEVGINGEAGKNTATRNFIEIKSSNDLVQCVVVVTQTII